MGKVVAGIVIGVLGVAVGAYIYVHYGFVNMAADNPGGAVIERFYLRDAMDRYAARYALKVNDPIAAADDNLIEGIRLYNSHCALCHGGSEKPTSEVGQGLYPRTPQFLKDAPDMPEYQNYWIIKHGIARTGMPAWDQTLSDTEIWKLVTFLSKMEELDKLAPAVQQAWRSGGQAEPTPALTAPRRQHDHHGPQ